MENGEWGIASFLARTVHGGLKCTRLDAAGRCAEQELLTANPMFSSFSFVCSPDISTRKDGADEPVFAG
ncbi:MAG: hypothetical protein LBJ01_05980, partial [Tannerella sp.]|nr:hypothetical protein [Tannerella sp.]